MNQYKNSLAHISDDLGVNNDNSFSSQVANATMEEKITFLQSITILSSFSLEQFEEVAELIQKQICPQNYIFYEQGEVAHNIYLIEDGFAQAVKNGNLVITLGPKSMFGEMDIINNTPREMTLIAASKMTAFVLPRFALVKQIVNNPELQKLFY